MLIAKWYCARFSCICSGEQVRWQVDISPAIKLEYSRLLRGRSADITRWRSYPWFCSLSGFNFVYKYPEELAGSVQQLTQLTDSIPPVVRNGQPGTQLVTLHQHASLHNNRRPQCLYGTSPRGLPTDPSKIGVEPVPKDDVRSEKP
jgi:hypothetical protein